MQVWNDEKGDNMKLWNGDCIELMKNIPDMSVDMVLCDLPYNVTNCAWDQECIDLDKLAAEYIRILKGEGVIALFGIQPFTTKLMNAFGKYYSHTWYWQKNNITGAAFAKKQPMRCIEEIHIFRKASHQNNKGMFTKTRQYMLDELHKCGKTRKELDELLNSQMTSHYFTKGEQFSIPTQKAYKKLQTTGCFKMPYDELKKLYSIERSGTTREEYRYYPQGLKKLEKPVVKAAGRPGGYINL